MKKAVATLQKIQIAVGAIFLLIFLVVVVYQIVSREMGIVAVWTEDVTRYAFIWAVFMGGGAMVYEKKHFAFTSISDVMKDERKKSALGIIISLIMLFFSVLMVYYGWQLTQQFWDYTWVNLPEFKRGPTWLCVPVCGVTSSIYLIQHIVDDAMCIVKGGRN